MKHYWCRAMGESALYTSEDDERPLITGKPVMLLVYLALTPDGRCGRDRLAELLWRSAELSDARHSLRQSLYRLRTATGGVELVRGTGGELRLADGVQFDFLEGERAAAKGELDGAVRLLRGTFLEGILLPESREFEGWAEIQRSRFEKAWVDAAIHLCERELAHGEAQEALKLAEALAVRRPFDDAPQRLVLASLAAAGRHAAALARYQLYADLLMQEFEEEPGEELRAYVEELEAYVAAAQERPASELPFVGRDDPWAQLEAAWRQARNGHGAVMLIEGAAGLGKTRLLSELVRRVAPLGGPVLHVKCYEIGRAVPYAAIAEALGGALDDPAIARLSPAWLAEASRLLPELRERFPDLPAAAGGGASAAAKRRLHRALVACLEAIARERTTLVTVDDLHWADAPSLEVLHLLSQRIREAPILLALTYRPAELSPAARSFARAALVGHDERLVVLEGLTLEDTGALLAALGEFAESGTGAEVARQLHRHSAGSPLFLSELLEALDRDGALTRRNGAWELAGSGALEALPTTLGKLIADRVDRLEPWLRACLETMAVAGDEVSATVLAGALRISEIRAEIALAALGEETLVRKGASGAFELLHDELRHLVYHGIPDARRRVLHAALGSALEAAGEDRRPGGAARLAHHFDQAWNAERAHRYASAAAEEAHEFAAEDARRAHLELATSHSPRALPPGTVEASSVEREGRERGRRREDSTLHVRIGRGVQAAAILAISVLLVALGARWLSSGGAEPLDYRQGQFYLGTTHETGYTHELVWPTSAEIPGLLRTLREPPKSSPPRFINRWVSDRGETHLKLFRLTGATVEQTTFGASDDYSGRWSPDRRHMLVHRGWRTEDDRFQTNVVLLDSLGRERARLTDTRYQDQASVWSPTGTRIAVRRDSMSHRTVWLLDADGSRPRNLTAEFGVPAADALGFSPDGRRLAVAYADTVNEALGVTLLDLRNGGRRTLALPHERIAVPELYWSPDGRWVAYGTLGSEGTRLWVASIEGTEGPYLMAELPNDVVPRAWEGDSDRHLARIELEPSVLELRIGEGAQASLRALAPSGAVLDVELRWTVTDTGVARVDTRGFVVGRKPGATTLVATAGGLLSDTGVVTVRLAPIDTLFAEDWHGGLDETLWRPFGQPRPRVLPGALADGRPAFFSHGDYNHQSGAFSRTAWTPGEEGYTVEVEARLEFDGRPWQNWHLQLFPDTVTLVEGEFVQEASPAAELGFQGSDPLRGASWVGCTAAQRRQGHLGPIGEPDSVHVAALQLRPDWVVECFLDGTLLSSGTLAARLRDRPLILALTAQSEYVRLYHGRVVITRGLRY